MARHRASKADIRAWIEAFAEYDLSRTCDEIRPGYVFNETCRGTVPQALTACLESRDFDDAVRLAVSLGGDTDTLTCIAASVAEPLYGGVPAAIAKKALSYVDAPIRQVVVRFRERFVR
jgi:ADP-ribosylglycohydrolase